MPSLWGVFYVLESKATKCSSQFWWNHLLGEKSGDLREAGKDVCLKLRAVLTILLLNQTIFFDCGKKNIYQWCHQAYQVQQKKR